MTKAPRFSIVTRLWLLVAVSLAVVGVLALFLRADMAALDRGYRGILDREVREESEARLMQVAFKKQVQEWKNILLRGHDAKDRAKYIDAFLVERRVVGAYVDTLSTITEPAARATVARFAGERHALDSAYDVGLKVFVASNGSKPFAVDSLLRGKDRPPTDRIDTLVVQLERARARGVEVQQAAVAQQRATLAIVFGALLAVMVLVPFAVDRTMVRPLRRLEEAARRIAGGDLGTEVAHRSSDELGDLAEAFRTMQGSLRSVLREVSASATHMAATSEALSSGGAQINAATADVAVAAGAIAEAASVQTTAVTETLGSTQTVALRAREGAGRAREADALAQAARRGADEGLTAAAAIGERFDEIARATHEAHPAIVDLHARARRVRGFVEVIGAIASQSKLLALNAAIEAARAGDQGRGFAVVADEVGKLSLASSDALASIRELVEEMETAAGTITTRVSRVDEAVAAGRGSYETADDVLRSLQRQAADTAIAAAAILATTDAQQRAAEELAATMESIAASAEENAATAQQVSASTEEQAAATHEIASSAEELAGLARRLTELVAPFALDAAPTRREPMAGVPR